MSAAASALLRQVRQCGIVLTAEGASLRYRAPPGALAPDLRAALVAHKADLLALLQYEEREIAWRVALFRSQVPTAGPIPVLVVHDLPAWAEGCLSCGAALDGAGPFRCHLCSAAVHLVVETTESQYL